MRRPCAANPPKPYHDTDMTSDSNERPAARLGNFASVEVLGKAALAGVSCIYVAGFLITNIHLASYGSIGVELVRADYFSAGLLWAALLVPWFFFVNVWSLMGRRTSKAEPGLPVVIVIVLLLLTAQVAVSLSTMLAGGLKFIRDGDTWIIMLGMITSFFFVATPCYVVQVSLHRFWLRDKDATFYRMGILTVAPIFVGIVVSTATYAVTVYPRADRMWGGGRPEPAMVLLAVDAPKDLHDAVRGLRDTKSGTCLIIGETSDWIILAGQSRHGASRRSAIRIRRELVSSILTTGRWNPSA